MILKSTPKYSVPIYEDLRVAPSPRGLTPEKIKTSNYIHFVPKLPNWTNKEYKTQKETQNLFHLTCACEDYKERSEIFGKRDVRILCQHLYWKLTQTRASRYFDKLTKLLAHDSVFHKEWIHFKTAYKDKDIIIGHSNYRESGWMNVYYQFYDDDWLNIPYSFNQNRWKRGIEFQNHEYLEQHLRMLVLYGF